VTAIVFVPTPEMSKVMVSVPARAFAVWIAARSVHWLPGSARSASQKSSGTFGSSSSSVVLTIRSLVRQGAAQENS
jgi:hypothetical protein